MALQEAPERRNLYRRFMSTARYDHGWLTGPVWGVTVQVPGIGGLVGLLHFSGQAIGELTQERPLLLAQALESISPVRSLEGMFAIREILLTGNLEQVGTHLLAAMGSAALIVGAGFLNSQAQLGFEDSRRAEVKEAEECRRRYLLRNRRYPLN